MKRTTNKNLPTWSLEGYWKAYRAVLLSKLVAVEVETSHRSLYINGKQGNRGDTLLFHSGCRMAEAMLTTKAVKSRPSRVALARVATLSVPAEQYRD